MFSATNWTGRDCARCLHVGYYAMGSNKRFLFYFIAYVFAFWDDDDVNHVLDIGKNRENAVKFFVKFVCRRGEKFR